MQSADKPPRVWIDVTTLLWFRGNPTGIVRVVTQLVRHWLTDAPAFRLCAFDPRRRAFRAVDPDELHRPAPPCGGWQLPRRDIDAVQRAARVRWYWIELRKLRWHQLKVLVSLGWLTRGAALFFLRRLGRLLTWRPGRTRPWTGPTNHPFAPCDVVLEAGAGWLHKDALADLVFLQDAIGLRPIHLIHDITPVRHPQWCPVGFVQYFGAWLPEVLRHSALLLTISEHSRRDLIAYAGEQGIDLPAIEVVREGDEPGDDQTEEAPPGLPEGPFALCVSAVAPHKNHSLLLHVWRRLLERHGRDRIPTLALVGQPAFFSTELFHQLDNDPRLQGKVIHLAKVNDRQLRWLYRRCQFTLYPSHYEGWGLPVAESLIHGKPCICSNASSLPEVGGDFVDYHDPLDAPACVRLVESALFEPGWLEARQERIRRDYRVTSWRDCARQITALLDKHFPIQGQRPARDAA